MLDKVPIAFEHKGNHFAGYLDQVSGAGSSSVFHLMVNGYYFGRLRYTDKWVFDSTPKFDLSGMANVFGDFIAAWYR